ncbi:LytTR family DNA-binding domain-containing protein [Telluribacter sp. SYSU D00476]|uniref:LytR/AlgR family response regulator transcription factor n=1 Tax=Telluribacter sp. SYSU D00476 TaxID=2811430 RepID=UPI001FF10961|nr:LytTR family DNA-binding domain-containing protein [Telluribacter sp. SYSU D00476]
MTYTCIIVEDEPLARSLLEQYIQKIPYLQLVNQFSNALSALDFLHHNSVDIMFSDIQMPEVTGIAMLKILQKKPLIILTTAYSEYALEGYELDVADYLLKPITFERFIKSVEKVTRRLHVAQPTVAQPLPEVPALSKAAEPQQSFIFVKDGTRLVKVRLDEITYIEGLKDYVAIHTIQKKIVSLQTMKSLESQLPADRFIRIHNSYIVALEAIESIDREKVQIGAVYLPISDTYRKAFREFIERNQIGE